MKTSLTPEFIKDFHEINKRWVYGTKNKKWILVGVMDRDYNYGISQKSFNKLGEKECKKIYLNANFNRPRSFDH